MPRWLSASIWLPMPSQPMKMSSLYVICVGPRPPVPIWFGWRIVTESERGAKAGVFSSTTMPSG
jgi:hypothetical protein